MPCHDTAVAMPIRSVPALPRATRSARGASRLRRLAGCVARRSRTTIQPHSIERRAVIGRARESRSPSPNPGSAAIVAAERRGGEPPPVRNAAPRQPRRNSADAVVPFDTFLVLDEYEQNLGRIGLDYHRVAT